jgi:GGDEF domain-containing protein
VHVLPLILILSAAVSFSSALSIAFVVMGLKAGERNHEARWSVVNQLGQQISRGKQISLHDPATLLLQPWYFELRVAEEISRCQRYGAEMALVRIEMPSTPASTEWRRGFVDELGHNLHKALRSTDLVARVGEREFLACLPQTTESGARAIAGRVVTLNPSLALSVGWAVCPQEGTSLHELSERASIGADRRLAKVVSLPLTNSYREILERVNNEESGEIIPQAGLTPRAIKLRLRKASKEAGVTLNVWDADGTVFFERRALLNETKAS